jgi:hypothetical protein
MKEETLTQIGLEAAKPFSAFIDALLGPKINRLKKWAENQELQDQLKSDRIDTLLRSYWAFAKSGGASPAW